MLMESRISDSQVLERVQSDRIPITKPEEDRRRRTIIVEKRNGSFGFTLQSYGIHYKREQEIEMITYVDYVDYDGPAYRAGMREGDVILSINGTDMEKADHKTLVTFIKGCDARMRMVVLFEDCVRKVELHMKYIQLQRILHSKMNELEKLCLRERQLLEGKWKTHSLPARKKASQTAGASAKSANPDANPSTPTQKYSYCRPTVSTENVAALKNQNIPPPQTPQPTLIFAYQYLDPNYHYMLQPSPNNSREYLLTFEQPRFKSDQHHFIVKTPQAQNAKSGSSKSVNQTVTNTSSMPSKSKKSQHGESQYGHLCNPCIRANNNGDNTSLEAYDLASPCCDPHCVPTGRRRSRHQNKDSRKGKRDCKMEESTQTDPIPSTPRVRPHSTASSHTQTQTMSSASIPRKYFQQLGAGLVSQCSLHSCTSSELSAVAPTTMAESSTSYTTSLSTDTLYWDGSCDMMSSRQLSVKSNGGSGRPIYQPITQHPQNPSEAIYVQYKPKSWDNLTAAKVNGTYNMGYGYGEPKYASVKPRTQTKIQYVRTTSVDKTCMIPCAYNPNSGQIIYAAQPQQHPQQQIQHRKSFQAQTKSAESLLLDTSQSSSKYLADEDADSSCECLDVATSTKSPAPDGSCEQRFFNGARQMVLSPTDPNFGYYSAVNAASRRPQMSNAAVSTSSGPTPGPPGALDGLSGQAGPSRSKVATTSTEATRL